MESVILLASEARNDRTFIEAGTGLTEGGGFRPLPSLRLAGPLPGGGARGPYRLLPVSAHSFPSPDSLRPLAGRLTILILGLGDGLEESDPQRARALRCASQATPEVPCRRRPRAAAVGNLISPPISHLMDLLGARKS